MLRAVLDTNVLLASQKSKGERSPNAEILLRSRAGDFTLLCSDDMLLEYVEKLVAHDIPDPQIVELVRYFQSIAEWITIRYFHFRHYPVDTDDIMFLLCALNGTASHLVTYDTHLRDLRGFYEELFRICSPTDFLSEVRKTQN